MASLKIMKLTQIKIKKKYRNENQSMKALFIIFNKTEKQ